MTSVLVGMLLVFAGFIFMAYQPLRKGRLSGGRRLALGEKSNTLEPARPAGGFSLKSNWPGLALVAIGSLLLLVGSHF